MTPKFKVSSGGEQIVHRGWVNRHSLCYSENKATIAFHDGTVLDTPNRGLTAFIDCGLFLLPCWAYIKPLSGLLRIGMNVYALEISFPYGRI